MSDDLYPLTPNGLNNLIEDSDDMLDAWFAERGVETSRAMWKRRALAAERALEAAQARIEAVRRETVEECARVAEERAKDRVTLYSDRSREPHEIKASEAQHTAAAILALTEAKVRVGHEQA